MNKCIVELLTDGGRISRFIEGLPVAFEIASNEIPKRNPAIGLLREHILIGYFISEFGNDQVNVPEQGNKRGFDAIVCGKALSIKTITGSGNVKILWTVDQEQVSKEIRGRRYNPDADIFLVSINWGKTCESVFYIPLWVQSEIFKKMGAGKYLYAPTGTNHRGISIRGSAMAKLKKHPGTIKCLVDWQMSGLTYTPYERWEKFWKSR